MDWSLSKARHDMEMGMELNGRGGEGFGCVIQTDQISEGYRVFVVIRQRRGWGAREGPCVE